jgi:DNA-binding IclR family transcriptional regulator
MARGNKIIDAEDIGADDTASAAKEVPVPAVRRAAAMLRLLSNTSASLGVNKIARELDIIPSTCLHILRTLTSEGLVDVDPLTKRYKLGLQILTLAKAVLRETISEQAQPYLDGITQKYGVTAMAVSASGTDYYVVTALSHAPQSIRLHVDLGSRFPALNSATGRCFAAYSNKSRKQLKAEFAKLRWYDAPSFEKWESEVARVRETGYAVDDGNYLNGVGIVAAPILGKDGRFEHALVAVCIRDWLHQIGPEVLAQDIKERAASLEEHIS